MDIDVTQTGLHIKCERMIEGQTNPVPQEIDLTFDEAQTIARVVTKNRTFEELQRAMYRRADINLRNRIMHLEEEISACRHALMSIPRDALDRMT